ncbi:MAG TPA: 30S ribosomal protein S16 [Anaerolineae bacterium]
MLRIRLTRTGKKKQPSYRVVVTDINAKRDGRIVERIGYYNPLKEPTEYRIEEARALYWLSVGAQPTDAVRRLLDKQGTFGRLTRLHAGEELEALVAEYKGEPVEAETEPVASAEVAEAEPAAAPAETVAEVEETTAETVDEAAVAEAEALVAAATAEEE